MKDPIWHNGMLLCRDCDVFVGYGAIGTARMPKQSSDWLTVHCWVCERDYTETIEAACEAAAS